MNQIPIAHIILNMTHGGAETLVVDLATKVDRVRFKPSVICLDGIRGNVERLQETGVPCDLIPRRQIKFDLQAAQAVADHARRQGVRLLHAHDLSSLSYAAFAGLCLGVPVIMTEHSRHYIDQRLLRRLEKRFLGLFTKHFVEVSPHLAEKSFNLDGIPRRKTIVIENGVDLERFNNTGGKTFRHEIGCVNGEFLIGMVGRLEEIKGPGHLLAAFARIADRFPHARIIYAGDGSLRRHLVESARATGLAERVNFLGARSDVATIMRGLDAVVLPSLSEGLPFAMLEAMASSRPVVASAVGRTPQVVSHLKSGLLVPPGDETALASALAFLLESPETAQRMGIRGREIVAQRYAADGMIKSYETLYLELLGKPT